MKQHHFIFITTGCLFATLIINKTVIFASLQSKFSTQTQNLKKIVINEDDSIFEFIPEQDKHNIFYPFEKFNLKNLEPVARLYLNFTEKQKQEFVELEMLMNQTEYRDRVKLAGKIVNREESFMKYCLLKFFHSSENVPQRVIKFDHKRLVTKSLVSNETSEIPMNMKYVKFNKWNSLISGISRRENETKQLELKHFKKIKL